MRSQTISATSDGTELMAQPVDASGWLIAPDQIPTGQIAEGQIPTGQIGIRTDGATGVAEPVERRAEDPHFRRRTGRSSRRSTRVRRRRPAPARSLVTQGVRAGQPAMVRVAGGAEAPEGYRLGRWARLMLTATVLAAAVVVGVALLTTSPPATLVDVTVAPGDTLWSIANAAAPDRDPRVVIEEIRQLNDVPGDTLPIGVVLRVPVSTE